MLAQQDEYIDTAYGRILRLSEDEKMRQLAEARQDQIMQQNDMKYHFQQEIAERDAEIAERDAELIDIKSKITSKDTIIANKDSEIATLKRVIERLKNV